MQNNQSLLLNTLLLILLTCLSGCSGSKKVQPIVEFTTQLSAEVPKRSETIKPISRDASIERFTKHRVAKASLVALPIKQGNVIYSLDEYAVVHAFNYDTSKFLWSTKLSMSKFQDKHVGGGLAISGGKLYINYGDVYVVELDINTGYETMRARLTDITSTTPVIFGDKVLVQTDTNQLLAFGESLTTPLWRHAIYPEVITTASNVHPAIYKDNVIVPYSSGHVFYVNSADGSQIWRSMIDTPTGYLPNFMPAGIHTQPIIDNNTAYIATSSGELVKMGLDEGETIWRKRVDDIQSVAKNNDILFVTNNARQVAALSAFDGKVIWATSLIAPGSKTPEPAKLFAPMMVNNNLLVFSDDGKRYELNPQTGTLLQERSVPKNILFVDWSEDDKLMVFYNNSMMITE